ncbi:hypothetical protein Mp_1g18870 [Marchantia polymorpha subsp. ruderalis]|uniref:Uncharacterized protein n=2 Tax=Marchantia polymorpha TaxID=3197 RepID=A0AAF6ARP8_MARPO|nr:hypothetical protein MARPO_0001s0225 [Marchantia polymorpha]BBM99118.1 hypothetical protein Mp_1g18870 [Marchantia polymorpha subsp. ruderalis]|eukprot:PTQ50195.1 hypothetical protein MARPO_0001s0225 [Marchantia polymorpha]
MGPATNACNARKLIFRTRGRRGSMGMPCHEPTIPSHAACINPPKDSRTRPEGRGGTCDVGREDECSVSSHDVGKRGPRPASRLAPRPARLRTLVIRQRFGFRFDLTSKRWKFSRPCFEFAPGFWVLARQAEAGPVSGQSRRVKCGRVRTATSLRARFRFKFVGSRERRLRRLLPRGGPWQEAGAGARSRSDFLCAIPRFGWVSSIGCVVRSSDATMDLTSERATALAPKFVGFDPSGQIGERNPSSRRLLAWRGREKMMVYCQHTMRPPPHGTAGTLWRRRRSSGATGWLT